MTSAQPRPGDGSPCGDHLTGILGASYGLKVPDAHPHSSGRFPQPAAIRLGRPVPDGILDRLWSGVVAPSKIERGCASSAMSPQPVRK